MTTVDLKKAYADKDTASVARAPFCQESRHFRVARDVFFYAFADAERSPDGVMFVVKAWRSTGHRVEMSYGNAYGTFLVQAAKRPFVPLEPLPHCEEIVYDSDAQGYYFVFPKIGLGNKAAMLAGKESFHTALGLDDADSHVLSTEQKADKILSALADLPITCHAIPTETQENKSKVKAEMTCLASFVEISLTSEQASEKVVDGDILICANAALDPALNLHAGVLANFCIEQELCSKALATHGWVGSEHRFPQVQLPPSATTVRSFGGDTSADMAGTLKRILCQRFGVQPEQATPMVLQGTGKRPQREGSAPGASESETQTKQTKRARTAS